MISRFFFTSANIVVQAKSLDKAGGTLEAVEVGFEVGFEVAEAFGGKGYIDSNPYL